MGHDKSKHRNCLVKPSPLCAHNTHCSPASSHQPVASSAARRSSGNASKYLARWPLGLRLDDLQVGRRGLRAGPVSPPRPPSQAWPLGHLATWPLGRLAGWPLSRGCIRGEFGQGTPASPLGVSLALRPASAPRTRRGSRRAQIRKNQKAIDDFAVAEQAVAQ